MSTLAVFLALGGGAWAVSAKRNSVTDRQLAAESVGSSELKRNAAKGSDIAEGTLGVVPSAEIADSASYADSASTADTAYSAETAYTADLAYTADTASFADTAGSADTAGTADSASSADTAGSASTVEPAGVDTAAIQAGAVKAAQLGVIDVRKNSGTLGVGPSSTFTQVACEGGDILLGGGVFVAGENMPADAHVVRSAPNPTGTGWQGGVYNGNATQSLDYEVRALCLEG
jgi:hypothetical protein